MKRGIIVFDQRKQCWKMWIEQQSYRLEPGCTFELRIQNKYYKASLDREVDWVIKIHDDVSLILHTHEKYKVRLNLQEFIEMALPF